ncbi:5-deoxy-glucuronate isomerase [Luteipulveratus mongoliensis]|uniref:5-deoxyglucuronate isomerase n=1 Tax=Luteipulveratus mongoliensis TaxID=571913 RepID=A0A0K1JHT0_9MICO|nr:5-deoxy-glucuronate isomerase [Luteipulveratus mongoliensis]AKU16150.1 5-deoxyglucuronate isomerase [Luteipulveratus mongoliensis]
MTASGFDNDTWFLPLGSVAAEGFSVCAGPGRKDWEHTSLRIAELAPGGEVMVDLAGAEAIVVPLSGAVTVTLEGTGQTETVELAGRESVFAGPTDVAYAPPGGRLTLRTSTASRVAVCGARVSGEAAEGGLVRLDAGDVPVELRGAGQASREVRNFGTPEVLAAQRIIACEVLTPGGNWSSYPPHKHDEDRPGEESELEEIYYFELQSDDAPDGADPVGYQRVYGTEDRPIDVLAEVRTGDVVLVPHGWHGPATAPPGYDLYYLNVMAGPGAERAWLICDDPAHAWVRDTWNAQSMDPRLPFGGKKS